MANPIKSLENKLAGEPEGFLTLLLLLLGIILICIALFGRPLLKVAAAAWVILP